MRTSKLVFLLLIALSFVLTLGLACSDDDDDDDNDASDDDATGDDDASDDDATDDDTTDDDATDDDATDDDATDDDATDDDATDDDDDTPLPDFALNCDGDNDYVSVPHHESIGIQGGQLTVEAWVNIPSFGENEYLIRKWWSDTGTYAEGYFLRIADQSRWQFSIGDASELWGCDVYADISINTNEWTHIAGVFDSPYLRIFENGELVAEESVTCMITSDDHELGIGGLQGSTRYYGGAIDEIRISNSARYAVDFTPMVRFESDGNTAALWHCDEGTGIALNDSGPYGNDGQLYGAGWIQR